MKSKASKVSSGVFILCIVVLLVVGYYYSMPEFNPVQTRTQLQNAYQDCVKAAPKGFDCAMVPIMVSKDFLEENYK